MAKITWKGEDDGDNPGPSFTKCFDMKFPKGQPVEVTDREIIKRAQRNQFFEVTGVPGRPPKADHVEDAS